jgi:integrase
MEGKIDIHGQETRFDETVEGFLADEGMLKRNRDLLNRFVWDCKLGKTVKGRAKKKIGKLRILKYIYILRVVSRWLGKPFDEVTPDEMEKLVFNIEENVYRKRNGNFSDQTKLDYKKTLKKFYKWLGKTELVEFMDMSVKPKDVPAITREEAERMVNSTSNICLKATLMVLFDGGARADEFLNLRIKDLTRKKYGNDNDCFWINIRYSKTFARTIPLPLCTRQISEWLTEHPERNNPEAQLFPVKYRSLSREVRVLAKKVLRKHVNLHMLRHSSATYWAPKMNRYQLCAKYGWAFSSDMPDRYIERKGIIFDQIAEKGDEDQTTRLQKENRQLMEKMEVIEREYSKVSKVVEFIMPMIENMDENFKRQFFEKRKNELTTTSEMPV